MPHPVGLAVRCSRALLSPWARFAVLVLLLAAAGAVVIAWHPQRLLTAHGWQPHTSGGTAVLLFAVAYGLATVAFVPRPLLNAAAGALYGIHAGLPAAIGGTVLGAGLAFLLGRFLGRDAVRPLLRGRVALSLDRQLSKHGFRSTLALRLFPGVPFAAANYAAAVSRVRLLPFLTATAAGSAANTAAYVVAGSRAASPTSPVFLLALGFLGVTGVAATVIARGAHTRSRAAAEALVVDPPAGVPPQDPAVSDAGPRATPARRSA
ncbi:VTT domain-containing protein [Streptomyces cocklensis]|uniref:TVP38/TMEM64 family protein n=1 Tax=Actinacidiphila cocklensis TaxID=887465 RepID=UPI002040C180|nr:VTT domain-containing protein [Actinacidiphila cocklensis]MDD1059791.1 VTT domain-containing protein [Actinacidiphila cocklensis]WSX72658.1 VTT domain-containing protein [Streptomyces sp. NBC_00899]WSX81273.1 VTT domain-containing protein [Streptomyces sp. NBC_00899]